MYGLLGLCLLQCMDQPALVWQVLLLIHGGLWWHIDSLGHALSPMVEWHGFDGPDYSKIGRAHV